MFGDIDNEALAGLDKVAATQTLKDKLPKGYLSVSQVAQYTKCGEAYYRRYVLDQPVPKNSFTVQGSGVHKAAEHLHLSLIECETNPATVEALEATYSDYLDAEIPDAQIMEEDQNAGRVKDVGIGLVRKYYTGAMGAEKDENGLYIPKVRPIAAESIFRVMLEPEEGEPVPFLGVIDLEEPDGIADLKTKRKAASQADADNSLQLAIYAHVRGKPNVRLDQLIKPTKTKPERYLRTATVKSKSEIRHALTIVSEVAEDIAAGRFRKTHPENWWCSANWCPYWKDCRGRT